MVGRGGEDETLFQFPAVWCCICLHVFLCFSSSSIKSIRYGLTDIVDNIRTHTHTHIHVHTYANNLSVSKWSPKKHMLSALYTSVGDKLRPSIGRSVACRSSVSYALASINLLFHNLSPPQFSDLKKTFLTFYCLFLIILKTGKTLWCRNFAQEKNGGNIFNICILVQSHPLTPPPLLLFNLIQIFANFHNFAILICVNCH